MKALNALKRLMEALNEMGLNLSNWPIVFIPLFRYTCEWHGVWTLSCWSLLRQWLFHRALSAPQELLQSGFQDPEVGHVHNGQPLCHSGQGRHAGVLSSPHSVPQRWDHQDPAADRVMLGRLWNATSHACDDVFLTKPQMSTAYIRNRPDHFRHFSPRHAGDFLGQVRVQIPYFPKFSHVWTSAQEQEAERRDEWHVSGTAVVLTHDGWPETQVEPIGQRKHTGHKKTPTKMCLDSWTLRNHRNTHVRMCRPRHVMPPRSPQHKPTAPRGRWYVHKH